MKRLLRRLAPVLLLALPLRASDDPAAPDARLTELEGNVVVSLSEDKAHWRTAEADLSLVEGDRVMTGSDGRAEIVLEGDTVIELGPDTRFTVKSMTPRRTLFRLDLGRLIAKVKPLLPEQKMDIETPACIAGIRGTELAVEQTADGKSLVGVFDEGRVQVTGLDGGAVELRTRQETVVERGALPLAPAELRRMMRHREPLNRIRRRKTYWQGQWRRRPIQERRAFRTLLRRRPALKRLPRSQMDPTTTPQRKRRRRSPRQR